VLTFSIMVLLPFCVSVFAETDANANADPVDMEAHGGFRTYLMEYLNKYKGATEGAADGRFKTLFPTIDKDRKNMVGYTTCVTFQGLALGYATQKSGFKLSASPSVYFFDQSMRRAHKIPPASFMATLPKGKKLATITDKTATYVDMSAPNSARPAPGDLFLLAFSKTQSARLQAGMFSHIGFITSVTKRPDGKEEWATVAGGGGSASQHQEKVSEGVMVVDPATALTGSVANQPGAERRLQGWVSLEALFGDSPGSGPATTAAIAKKPTQKAGLFGRLNPFSAKPAKSKGR